MESALVLWLNGLLTVSPIAGRLAVFFGSDVAYTIVFGALVALAYGYRRVILEAFLAAFLSRFVFTEIIRLFYDRLRPFEVLDLMRGIDRDGGYAFPSGHAAFFFAFAFVVYRYNARWGRALFLLATLMGIGRVVAGVHWPTDILGGVVVGYVAALLAVRITPAFQRLLLKTPTE